MRVIFTGGGTGGHIYPALAVAKGVMDKKPGVHILYVGTKEGMEAAIVPQEGIDFHGISGKGLPRRVSPEAIKAVGSNLKALWETKKVLKDFHPDLVVGTGGYVSGPVVLTAALFGIPTLLHEQNALPGITNKFLARFVKKVMVTFEDSKKYFPAKEKITVVGLPVRKEIGTVSRKEGADDMGLSPDKKTILVTGGSRGASSINKAMITVLRNLKDHPDLQVVWATGTATYEDIMSELAEEGIGIGNQRWKIKKYIDNMPQALACADLCICRAGAATLAELSAAGKASILIPYPYAAENHQEYNARVFEDRGASAVIPDSQLNGESLWQELASIIFNPRKTEEMGNKAAEIFPADALNKIVDYCFNTAWR